MSSTSPSVVLYNSAGVESAVANDVLIPAGTGGYLVYGISSDGYGHALNTDLTGNTIIVGLGTAGSPSGGVVSIQGVSGGTAVTISGTVAATQSGSWTVAATQSGSWTVTSNQGTPNSLANAWPVELTDGYGQLFGEPNNPINVTGTITVVNNSVGFPANPPPSEATYVGALATTAMQSGLTSGDMYPFNLTTTGLLRIDGAYPLATAVATAVDMHQVGGVATTAAPTYTTATVNALSLTTSGLMRIDGVYPINATTPTSDVTFVGGAVTTAAPTYTTGQLSALSLDTFGNLRVTGFVVTNRAATSTVTSVNASTSSITVLAANANRIGASIYNNSNKNMFILLGSGTASATNFTIMVMQGTYWEVLSDYTGQIDAVWANGATAAALITEITP